MGGPGSHTDFKLVVRTGSTFKVSVKKALSPGNGVGVGVSTTSTDEKHRDTGKNSSEKREIAESLILVAPPEKHADRTVTGETEQEWSTNTYKRSEDTKNIDKKRVPFTSLPFRASSTGTIAVESTLSV